MDPAEWEQTIADLFGTMGLAMGAATDGRWQATDPRPLFGGPVIVHAIRGRADAAATRALADAVAEAGATKGVLVALDGYEPDAHEPGAGRPLELLDGPAVLNLLKEHLGLKARIEPAGS